jgi:hypothetical protein
VCNIHVHVFMSKRLLNINMFMTKIQLSMNDERIRKYPKAGWVTESPNAPLFSGLTIRLTVGEP